MAKNPKLISATKAMSYNQIISLLESKTKLGGLSEETLAHNTIQTRFIMIRELLRYIE
jgi:hypothetical protein